jgi:hypothetical protein
MVTSWVPVGFPVSVGVGRGFCAETKEAETAKTAATAQMEKRMLTQGARLESSESESKSTLLLYIVLPMFACEILTHPSGHAKSRVNEWWRWKDAESSRE